MDSPLPREFYLRDTLVIARELLGKTLVHGETSGVIVETEAYMGPADAAAHSSGGKRTPRTEIMYGEGGYAYVYLIYGLYCCLNVVTSGIDRPECVLIRALEPVSGLAVMRARRGGGPEGELCRGPGRLCRALAIDRSCLGADLCSTENPSGLYITEGIRVADGGVEATPRIGVDYAGEARFYPWRFIIKGNRFVSR
jgi:DNA-3-methyladenine glycosylase